MYVCMHTVQGTFSFCIGVSCYILFLEFRLAPPSTQRLASRSADQKVCMYVRMYVCMYHYYHLALSVLELCAPGLHNKIPA